MSPTIFNSLLKRRAGVKTRKALYNGAGNVSVGLQNEESELHPWHYRGRGAWQGIKGHEPVCLVQTVSDAELGAAITTAVEVSRNA